jgi:prepilin signal peptidase PulO-like enzyme (type II secretory pathway)
MEFIQTILAVCGGVSIVGGAGAVVYKVIRPAVSVVKRVEVLEAKSVKDYAALTDLAEADRAICAALLAMLDHAIYGNHVEKLEAAKERIRKYLIEK